jgi:hypothetical protein
VAVNEFIRWERWAAALRFVLLAGLFVALVGIWRETRQINLHAIDNTRILMERNARFDRIEAAILGRCGPQAAGGH